MGAFALAHPKPFLNDNQFGFSLTSLLDQLHNATMDTMTCGNVLFVVDIVIPILSRCALYRMFMIDSKLICCTIFAAILPGGGVLNICKFIL